MLCEDHALATTHLEHLSKIFACSVPVPSGKYAGIKIVIMTLSYPSMVTL